MKKSTYFQPLGGSITKLLDPMLAKRTHVDAALALSWPDIAGEKLAGRTQPLKVTWPHRGSQDEPFKPGTLVVACEGAVALDLQYQTSELIDRINRFFGYSAVCKIQIKQAAIDAFKTRSKRKEISLGTSETLQLRSSVEKIENEDLRNSLLKLGMSIKANGGC